MRKLPQDHGKTNKNTIFVVGFRGDTTAISIEKTFYFFSKTSSVLKRTQQHS